MGRFIQWVDRRRALLGIRTHSDLSEISGVSDRTISRIFAEGSLKSANRSTRIWLARTLKVPLREMEQLDEGRIKDIPDSRIVNWEHCDVTEGTYNAARIHPVADLEDGIPIIGRVAAGGLVESYEDDAGLKLPIKLPGAKNVYALEIAGDSMEPDYKNGEFVIFQDVPPIDLRDGEDAMIQLDGASDGKASFKRAYLMTGGILKLVSVNSIYKPMSVAHANVIRVGRVVGKFTPPKLIGAAK